LFLNALLRLLDATGITHDIKRTPQWTHAAFADDLFIYVGTVRDGNKLLDVIHEFEFWSGLRIFIPKYVAEHIMALGIFICKPPRSLGKVKSAVDVFGDICQASLLHLTKAAVSFLNSLSGQVITGPEKAKRGTQGAFD